MTALTSNRNLLGVASLLLGIMLFSAQDAIIKFLSGDVAVTLAIVMRCAVALPILLVMVKFEGGIGRIASRNYPILVIRGIILLVAYTAYYMSLPALPLAEAIALFFIAPIFITVLAGPVLGEHVGPGSWAAVIVGFIGVLIIVQPGSALFEPAALLTVISAAMYAMAMIIARKVGVAEPATVMAFYQNAVYFVGATAAVGVFHLLGIEKAAHPSIDFLVRPWAMLPVRDFLLLGACGVIAALAMFLLTNAYRMAEARLVAVFEYSGMFWGPLWGFLVFSEIPKWTTVAGTLLIVAAGIYAVRAASPAN